VDFPNPFRRKTIWPWVVVREIRSILENYTWAKQKSAHEPPWISPVLHAAIADYVLEFAGGHMHLDEPFPLEAIPHRVGRVLLREFKGHCPSVREVDEIPDKN
jgi:hypothetical protein